MGTDDLFNIKMTEMLINVEKNYRKQNCLKNEQYAFLWINP